MIRRARLLSVAAIVAAGAIGLISSTQTWLVVTLTDGADQPLMVAGASALPVLAPLSLAVLALGGALSIAGAALRYVIGALTVVLAASLAVATFGAWTDAGVGHVAATVTEVTGIAGAEGVSALVGDVTTTAWPPIAQAAWILLFAVGIFTLATAHRWGGSGRRYAAGGGAPAGAASRPHDAIDDWDDLSRGEDPTA